MIAAQTPGKARSGRGPPARVDVAAGRDEGQEGEATTAHPPADADAPSPAQDLESGRARARLNLGAARAGPKRRRRIDMEQPVAAQRRDIREEPRGRAVRRASPRRRRREGAHGTAKSRTAEPAAPQGHEVTRGPKSGSGGTETIASMPPESSRCRETPAGSRSDAVRRAQRIPAGTRPRACEHEEHAARNRRGRSARGRSPWAEG